MKGQTFTVKQVLDNLNHDLLAQAEIFKSNLRDQYFEILNNVFGSKERRIASITNLVRLPFRHVLTSNYDPALELHYDDNERPEFICPNHDAFPEFYYQVCRAGIPRHVVHVHGRYDEPQNVVLTDRITEFTPPRPS